ncbi:MAG: alpha/beta hydrolase-fold protein [Polyangiales bacterium]
MQGRVVRTSHESACLQGNPLGDSYERDIYVYLPPGYDGTRRFPVVMMLAGFGSTNHSIAAWSPWAPNTLQLFDKLIVDGECGPAILVLPDCFNRWGGSQFIDSEGSGRYQTYLADEVFPFVDAEFNTIADRQARAVVGRSSGGFGALRLGMDRPDVVSVIGSHAGDAAFEVSMRPMLTSAAIAFDLAGGVEAFAKEVPRSGPQNATQFDAIFTLAASAAYSPSSSGFPFADLPINPATGRLRDEVWARWLEHDPLYRIEASSAALQEMSLIYVDAGNRDEHGLHFAARLLKDALLRHGLPVHYDEFEGGHRGTSWRYEVSLPQIVEALRGPE